MEEREEGGEGRGEVKKKHLMRRSDKRVTISLGVGPTSDELSYKSNGGGANSRRRCSATAQDRLALCLSPPPLVSACFSPIVETRRVPYRTV